MYTTIYVSIFILKSRRTVPLENITISAEHLVLDNCTSTVLHNFLTSSKSTLSILILRCMKIENMQDILIDMQNCGNLIEIVIDGILCDKPIEQLSDLL